VGKHTAAKGSTVDPLVADALFRRAGGPAPHGEHSGGSTGWPGPEPEGGGAVGWPGDIGPAPDEEPQEAADRAVTPVLPSAPIASRRGWRKLFGTSPAA
jgi:hypothetical protein